jgi:hypothetical protein
MVDTTVSEPLLLTAAQVARRLGVSLATWKRMKKHFTSIRLPNAQPRYSWPVVVEELSRFIALSKENKSNVS